MCEFYHRLRSSETQWISYDPEHCVLRISELGDYDEARWLPGATAQALAEDGQWAILADFLEDHPEEEGTIEEWAEWEHGPADPELTSKLQQAQAELDAFRWEQHRNQEPELVAFWDRQVRNAEWWLSQLLHPAE